MATPTLRALRKRFADARIVGLMRPYVAETLAGNPHLDDVLLYDHRSAELHGRFWATVRHLRAERFDIAVLLTNSIRSALLARLGGVKRRVGYAREGRGVLLNDLLPVRRSRGGYQPAPVIDYYLALAYHLGAAREDYGLELFVPPACAEEADRLWTRLGFAADDRVVTFNPGAAYGGAKRWPSNHFANLARLLVDRHDARVLVLCGPNERGFARYIADASARPRHVRSMADERISLGLSMELVRRSTLLVTTDSGPRHFAAPFGTPAVSLFGPTHIEWTETYYDLETKLQKKLPCGPCQQRECPLGHQQCMTDLSVDDVYRAAAWRLNTDTEHRSAG